MQSALLAFNFLPIKTAWQIGLPEPKPLAGLSSSYTLFSLVPWRRQHCRNVGTLRISIQRQYYNFQFCKWPTTLRRISIFNIRVIHVTPMQRWRASSSNRVRISPNGIPRRLASVLSSIRACILGLDTSLFIAAFSELIAPLCSGMIGCRPGASPTRYWSQGWRDFDVLAHRRKWRQPPRRGLDFPSSRPRSRSRDVHSSRRYMLNETPGR